MRSELIIAAAFAVALPVAAAAADNNPKQKPTEYEAQYSKYLEVARATKADPAAPRWIDGLMGDPRAHAVNDLLTVRVVESMNAVGTADSQVNKNSNGSASVSSLFGLTSKLP